MIAITVGRYSGKKFRFSKSFFNDGTTWDAMIAGLSLSSAEAGEVYYSAAGDTLRSTSPATGNDMPGDGTVYQYVPAGAAMDPPVNGACLLLNPPQSQPLVVQPHPGGAVDARGFNHLVSGVNVIGAPGRVGSLFLSLQDVVLVGTALAEFGLKAGSFAGSTITVATPGTTPIPLAEVKLPVDGGGAGWIEWVISATDGTDQFAASYVSDYAAVSKAGVISSVINTNAALAVKVASGSATPLAVVGSLVSGTNKVTFTVTPAAASPVLTSLTVSYRIYDRLGNVIAPLG